MRKYIITGIAGLVAMGSLSLVGADSLRYVSVDDNKSRTVNERLTSGDMFDAAATFYTDNGCKRGFVVARQPGSTNAHTDFNGYQFSCYRSSGD